MAKKQFKAESKRLLGLMIDSIYTHKEIFLREIISNASDAIDKLCYKALTEPEIGLTRGDFFIAVSIDKAGRTVTVEDNGIGMTAEEMDSNLGVIARSGSLKFRSDMAEDKLQESDIDIIGQFGVGFYSAFMVSDKVQVISKAYGSNEANKWESTGADGYTITPCEKESHGTKVIMHIKENTVEEDYDEFLEDYRLQALIRKYSDYIRYPIKMDEEKSRPVETDELDEKGNKKTRYEIYTENITVNSMVPIWQRSKSEVSDDDCRKFYREKYYDTEDPVCVIRVNAEGSVSYRALLFVPKNAPFNYYTRDYEAGLQLYASGVMIMEHCADLLPECFRFVRGVVDSPDLSLNISREMLQHDRQLKVIAGNLEKRIKSELKKLMGENPDAYADFYKAFARQLKYGMLAGYGEKRDTVKDLLLFTASGFDKPISLDTYVSAMPEAQKYIYYAKGDSIAMLDRLPQTEIVKDAGYSVLYLTDDVDEFVMNILGSYKDKQLKSVTEDDLGLESEDKKEETEKQEEENKELLEFIKETLDGAVSAVKLSTKLKSSPACLGTQGPVSLEMEKYFSSIPGTGEHMKAERVLELNASHPVFGVLKTAFAEDKEKAASYAKLLHFESLLTSGMEIADPGAFADLVNSLIV